MGSWWQGLKGCKIDLVSHQLITSNGQVIMLNSQEKGRKHQLFAKVNANVGLPAYSELEILAYVGNLAKENQTYISKGIKLQYTSVMVAMP